MEQNKNLVCNEISIKLDGLLNVDNILFKNLNIYVGLNGTGKSLILKMYWCVNLISNLYFMIKKDINVTTKFFQFVLDKSFSDQDFTGNVKAKFDEFDTSFSLVKGKLDYFNVILKDSNYNPKPENLSILTYMSTVTRTYESIITYIKTKKILNITDIDLSNEADLEKLCKMYKLYDILFLEKTLIKLSDPFFKLSETSKEAIKNNINKEITNIFYDKSKEEIYYTELKDGKSETYNIKKLSSGEQSLLNMISAQS